MGHPLRTIIIKFGNVSMSFLSNLIRNLGTLFVAYLIGKNLQSTTIRSYVSAIKVILMNGGMKVNNDQVLLSALTRACHLTNDQVTSRIPIRKDLLGLLLRSIDDLYLTRNPQPYLAAMYKALFATAYYGLFCIGEIAKGVHVVKAVDVHIATNKNKMIFVLHTSKTHGRGDKPQIIKISAITFNKENARAHCPFGLLRTYLSHCKTWKSGEEQFFVFSDRTPVSPYHVRQLLNKVLCNNKIDHRLYSPSGFRSGRATDLVHLGLSIETIKKIGRWKSSAIYTYLRL